MASKGVNKVIIIGNLGKDPEVRYTPDGKAIANLTVATSETWKDQSGQIQEKSEWHRIVIFGKLAEIAGEYLRKGSKAYFEGKLQTRKWQDQSGQDRYTTEIALDPFNGVMQMLDSKPQGQQAPAQQATLQNQPPVQQRPQQQQAPQKSQPPKQPSGEPDFDFDDNIPFAPIGLQYPALLNCA